MPFSSRFRAALSRSTTSSSSSSSSSTTTTASTTPTSSPDASILDLTRTTSTLALTRTAATTSSTATSSTKSVLSASSLRSSSSKKSKAEKPQNWAKYAPKKFKFRQASPAHVAALSAWDFSESWGADEARRASVVSGVSPCASRRNSVEL